MRLPFTIIAVLLAILIPIGFLGSDADAPTVHATPIVTIARRVEAVRHLTYKTIPKPQEVTPAQAQHEGLADFDTEYPVAQRHADEAIYTLLGLLPPGADLREISNTILGEEVAGYYNPKDGRLRIVKGAATGGAVINEITLAHELDHALEDQAIGLDTDRASMPGDPGIAYTALLEGSATAVMFTYLERFFQRADAVNGIIGSAFAGGNTGGIPPFELQTLLFPYTAGRAFVADLYARANDTWTLVDLAERSRPPVSTEQILHPGTWIDGEQPEPVPLPAAPSGDHELTHGTFGEFQTRLLLATAGHGAQEAAGWGGDAYALYRSGDGPCDTPCRSRDTLVMRWTWDTPRDEREFAAAMPDLVRVLGPTASFSDANGVVTLTLQPR